MESKNLNKNLKSILNSWNFPQDVIDKYESIKIVDVFDWQAECLHLNSKLGMLNRNDICLILFLIW